MKTNLPLYFSNQDLKPEPHVENNFYLTDSEEFFIKHAAILDKSWRYRTKEIKYKFNSLGYRTEELEFYQDKEFILVLGASDVLGLGLAQDELWHHSLKESYNLEILNGGVICAGPDIIMLNTLLFLKNSKLKPTAVVIQWPELNRFSLKGDNSVTYLLPEIFSENEMSYSSILISNFIKSFRETLNKNDPILNFYKTWILDNNSVNQSQIFIETTRLIWNLTKIPYFDFIIDQENLLDKNLNIQNYSNLTCDLARDQLHYGHETHLKIGKEILKNLQINL